MFDLMEGTYGKEKVLIKQVKSDIPNRELLTLVGTLLQFSCYSYVGSVHVKI